MTTTLQVLMLFYGIFVVLVGLFRPQMIWNTRKVKAFRSTIGELGTSVFFVFWGGTFVVVSLLWIFNKI